MLRRDTCPQESKHLSCVSEDPLPPHTQVTATLGQRTARSIRNSLGDDRVLAGSYSPALSSEALPGARPTLPPAPQGLSLASNQ